MPKLPKERDGYVYKAIRSNKNRSYGSALQDPAILQSNIINPKSEFEEKKDVDTFQGIGPITTTNVHIPSDTIANHYRGLRKRVAHKNHFKQSTMDQFKSFVKRYVRRHYQPIPKRDLTHEYLDTWLDGSKYTVKEKRMFHEQLDRYLDPTVQVNDLYAINSFIKKEFTDLPKEPRIINAPSTIMKVLTGPYIKEMEHHVYDEHFIKHCTPTEVLAKMEKISEGRHRVYETDYSSFEGTFSTQLMKSCEMLLFERILANNPNILKIIRRVEVGSRWLHYRHGLGSARLEGSRLSGCLWTSMANGFTNKMVVEFMANETRKKHGRAFNFDYLVEGDDGFIVSDVPLLLDVPSKLGLKLKVVEATDMNGLSFCGICKSPQGLMPDFYRTIHKFGYTHEQYLLGPPRSKRQEKRRREMLKCKAQSLLATAAGVPILQELAMNIITRHTNVTTRIKDYDWWEYNVLDITRMKLEPKPISATMREFFAEHTGISVREQLRLETLIRQETTDFYVLDL